MEFLVLLFIGWIFWTIVGAAVRQQKQAREQLPPSQPTQPDWYALAQSESGHVRVVGAPEPDTAQMVARLRARMQGEAVLPARSGSEESTSELMWDELAGDREIDATGATPAEIVSLESTEVLLPAEVTARPVISLEQEVDWEVEHQNFHRRYVDVHSSGSAARHGLMDEMRDPGALRRAVLMAEILGPPKSLRK
jgi:hypothetical protein